MDGPSAPPPAYGATVDQHQQPGQEPPPQGGYSDPPPKYEPPKEGQGFSPPPQQYPPPPHPGQQYAYQQPNGPQYPYQHQPQGQPYPYQQQPQVEYRYPTYGYQGATVYPGVVHQTVIVQQPGYGPLPKTMDCPNCRATITTSLTYQHGGLTYLSAGLLCLFGCWMGCCLVPFCMDDLSDVQHRCPNCGKHIATYTRL